MCLRQPPLVHQQAPRPCRIDFYPNHSVEDLPAVRKHRGLFYTLGPDNTRHRRQVVFLTDTISLLSLAVTGD